LVIELAKFKDGFDSVLKSKHFLKVLEVVLAIGNFLNHGSRSGNTVGFDISILGKLSDTRSNDTEGNTLLDFVILTLEAQYPEAIAWTTELAALKESKAASWEKIDLGIKELKAQTILVRNLSKQVESAGSHDRFGEIASKIEKCDHAFEQTKIQLEAMQKKWEEVAEKFAKDAAGMKPEEFFGEIYEVVDKFELAIKEKKKKLIAAEKLKNKTRAEEEIHRLKIANNQKEASLKGTILKMAEGAETEGDKEAAADLTNLISGLVGGGSAGRKPSPSVAAAAPRNPALMAKVNAKEERSKFTRDERRKQLAEKRKEQQKNS